MVGLFQIVRFCPKKNTSLYGYKKKHPKLLPKNLRKKYIYVWYMFVVFVKPQRVQGCAVCCREMVGKTTPQFHLEGPTSKMWVTDRMQ